MDRLPPPEVILGLIAAAQGEMARCKCAGDREGYARAAEGLAWLKKVLRASRKQHDE